MPLPNNQKCWPDPSSKLSSLKRSWPTNHLKFQNYKTKCRTLLCNLGPNVIDWKTMIKWKKAFKSSRVQKHSSNRATWNMLQSCKNWRRELINLRQRRQQLSLRRRVLKLRETRHSWRRIRRSRYSCRSKRREIRPFLKETKPRRS